MIKTASRVGLGAILALGLLAAPVAFAEEGKTTTGGASSNSGSSGDKTDKSTQENAASAEKGKQSGSK